MSWDILVMNFPLEAKKVEDIPDDFQPPLLGKRSEIIDGICDVFPTANFSDPSWGLIDGHNWSIEVSLGSDEECGSFSLHVRGGDAAVGAVAAILRRLNLRAIDCQTSEFFVADESALDSFLEWKNYLDHIIRSGHN